MNISPEVRAAVQPFMWGIVAGAVALGVVGFKYGGWHTTGQAVELAKAQVQTAIVAQLAPICAANFRMLPDAVVRTAALRAAETWRKGEQFKDEAAKWVTMPGESYPNSALVAKCSTLVLEPQAAAIK